MNQKPTWALLSYPSPFLLLISLTLLMWSLPCIENSIKDLLFGKIRKNDHNLNYYSIGFWAQIKLYSLYRSKTTRIKSILWRYSCVEEYFRKSCRQFFKILLITSCTPTKLAWSTLYLQYRPIFLSRYFFTFLCDLFPFYKKGIWI